MADLSPHESFSALLTAELRRNAQASRRTVLASGHVLFREGDIGDGMYLVEAGRIEISAAGAGPESRVLSHFEPGGFFGEMAILEDQPRSATAVAVSETIVHFIPRDHALRLLENSPRLLFALMQEFSARMRNFTQHHLQEVLQAERHALVGRFARTIVHDFKNPLNIIGMAADVLGLDNMPVADRTDASVLIRKQVTRLSNMINELLDFTREGRSAMELAPTDYAGFICEVLQDLQLEARERSVTLETESAPPAVLVALDVRRLPHVFYNLVNNAIDFMPDGGRIILRFRLAERDVTTELEDSGPGIAPEIASSLFEPFATHGKAHGTGLGLSICKRIVEEHGGQISAKSAPDRGAIFSFTLPRHN